MTQTMLSERADEESPEQTSQPWHTRFEGNIFVAVHTFPDRRVSHNRAFPPRFPSSTCSLRPYGLTPEKLHTPHNKAPGTCLAEETWRRWTWALTGVGSMDHWAIRVWGLYHRDDVMTYGHRLCGTSEAS